MLGWRSTARAAWPLLQGTAAATVAWIAAKHVALHPEPFFAPIAAVIGLNAPFGERGSNTLRLLLGVFVGIIVAELTLLVLGAGYGRLALATFVAMAVARALGGARIVIGQAAASAILTLATADGEYGLNRVGDAMIGATIALGFSQLLFSPEPVGLVRRAEKDALAAIAEGFARTARALQGEDPALVERALDYMRDLRDRLTDLSRSRRQSPRVARHSALWWGRRAPLRAERERASHLDLLGTSCLMLTRTALVTLPPDRAPLAPTFRELGRVFAELAKDPGDRAARQAAVDRAVLLTHRFDGETMTPGSTLAALVVCLRLVAADLVAFAGVPREQSFELSPEASPP
jgi:uncharacterized membrane protein YgaE (UPF0421/DUF939 family)